MIFWPNVRVYAWIIRTVRTLIRCWPNGRVMRDCLHTVCIRFGVHWRSSLLGLFGQVAWWAVSMVQEMPESLVSVSTGTHCVHSLGRIYVVMLSFPLFGFGVFWLLFDGTLTRLVCFKQRHAFHQSPVSVVQACFLHQAAAF